MARAYKANRARGTRQSTYKKKVYEFGGFKVSAKRNLTIKQYKEQFYQENITAIESKYETMARKAERMLGPRASEAFRQQYRNAEEWFKKTSKEITSVKSLKEKVISYYGEEIQRFKNNAWTKITQSEDYKTIQELFDEEGESFDINKLRYNGDSVYTYITNKGTVITITFNSSEDSSNPGYCSIVITK